jgi:hypothetical protein
MADHEAGFEVCPLVYATHGAGRGDAFRIRHCIVRFVGEKLAHNSRRLDFEATWSLGLAPQRVPIPGTREQDESALARDWSLMRGTSHFRRAANLRPRFAQHGDG